MKNNTQKIDIRKEQTCALISYTDRVPADAYENLYREADNFIQSTDEPCFLVGGNNKFDMGCINVILALKHIYPDKNVRIIYIARHGSRYMDNASQEIRECDEVRVCESSRWTVGKKANRLIKQYMINQSSAVLVYFSDAPAQIFKSLS